jgi:XRE family aerobic/anaerobic benzoate catabolism transcriptional regulator
LAQFEVGESNIAVSRLDLLVRGLGISLLELLQKAEELRRPKRGIVALVGLRGAGKTALGLALARHFSVPFLEHDQLVEDAAGLSVPEVFELHGADWYRRLARETLLGFLDKSTGPLVIATSGGIVEDSAAYGALLAKTTTVWLEANAEDHYSRVEAQGDRRPMRDRPNAMQELNRLLLARAKHYSEAQVAVKTSGRAESQVLAELVHRLGAELSESSGSDAKVPNHSSVH